jgi:hypothetical protein
VNAFFAELLKFWNEVFAPEFWGEMEEVAL